MHQARSFRWRSLRPSFRWYRPLSFWQDTGHKLRTLSYFEFYRPCIQPLYIHKYPVSSAADQCPLTSLTSAPLDVSTHPRLFHDITGTDVKNLTSSLRSNTPVFFAEALEASGAAGAAEDQQRAMYKPGDFVFGYEDVLGWIVRGITYPSCSTAIAEYMNTLEVVGCTLVTGVAQEWQITIESGTRARYTAYCRMTPSPQRTLDVVPLILRNEGPAVWTTVSRRRRATVVIDGEEVATVGRLVAGRDTIVGAGEHVETTDLVPELAAIRDMQLAAGAAVAIIPVLTARNAAELKATKRALTEEVGLAPELLERARVWLIGQHRVPASAAIARDLRYWPRVGSEQVVYGYRRETSTIIYAALRRPRPTRLVTTA